MQDPWLLKGPPIESETIPPLSVLGVRSIAWQWAEALLHAYPT